MFSFCIFRRAYVDVLKPFFEEHIINNQSIFQFSARYESLLEMIPDAGKHWTSYYIIHSREMI